MTLAKAKLKWMTIIPPNMGEIDCQFNPSTLTISKTNNWANAQSPAYNAPTSDFQGGSPATYSLALYFDSYSSDTPKDVREYTNKLLRLTLRGYGYSMFKIPYSNPPSVKFVWGNITLFKAVVQSVNITYTMFAPDGTPIRAKADVTFKQQDYWDDWLPAQNPTSRTDPRRTRVVDSRQRLDLIAYEEYGDSRYWRVLAEANHLDDPFSLQDGQIIVIPDVQV
jgi:nucleoid-associated protein YgaU